MGVRLDILAACVHFQQFDINRHAFRIFNKGILKDFFSLDVPAIGQVHIGLGNRIYIGFGIKLARRIQHGGLVRSQGTTACRRRFRCINILAARGMKERVRRVIAFRK